MNEFKIGDRVVVTAGGGIFFSVGNVGTIVEFDDDGDCVVEFDPNQPGVDYTCGVISAGSWFVPPCDLEYTPENRGNPPWYETEEGKEWLSNQNGIEEQFVQEKQKRMPKRGDHYLRSGENVEYILAQPTNHDVCLIGLTTGNRWADPVKVIDPFAITEDEWSLISIGDVFTLVE